MVKRKKPDPVSGSFNNASGGRVADEAPVAAARSGHPVSLRMTFEEKMRLDREAAGMSLAAYIRWRLFDPDNPPPKSRGKHPVKDHQALSQLLALLGQSRLANNMNQLARAANSGSLPFTPETERLLTEAASDIAEMRKLLLDALNLEPS
ncbi:MobC family plasmid mobilization relaxosome protein [Brevundimonas vesicularis]|nr:MobC family plasmid mobilization relaxosome protein [Brevundimonas vesicularis]